MGWGGGEEGDVVEGEGYVGLAMRAFLFWVWDMGYMGWGFRHGLGELGYKVDGFSGCCSGYCR